MLGIGFDFLQNTFIELIKLYDLEHILTGTALGGAGGGRPPNYHHQDIKKSAVGRFWTVPSLQA